jgi:hypothetical protein
LTICLSMVIFKNRTESRYKPINVEILKGSKQEISEQVAKINGKIPEAIVFIEEPSDAIAYQDEDVFAEMEPFTVSVDGADYSREFLYGRM